MTQAKTKPLTFAEFLERDDADNVLCDLLADGSLVAVPEEAAMNSALAFRLAMRLAAFLSDELIKINCLTLEVNPVGDNRVNRRPDLAILHPEHLTIDSVIRRTALFLGDLPPRFVAEVVSRGNENSDGYRRDYEWKRKQYQAWGIPEYWILDPHRAQITVLVLVDVDYQATLYQGDEAIKSTEFPELELTVDKLLINLIDESTYYDRETQF